MVDKNNKTTRKMKQNSSKMNRGLIGGLAIFVLLFGLASHSLVNSAFATANTSHEKINTPGFSDFYKTNVKLPKDKSLDDKIKKELEKIQAEIKRLKEKK